MLPTFSDRSVETNDRGGFALVTVLLVVMTVAVLATGAAMIGSSNILGNRYYAQQSQLGTLSRAGLEEARAAINADKSIYPDSGYVVLEDGITPTGVDGLPLTGVQRWTYAGPTGSVSGQYGIFGSIVTVVRDGTGAVAISRSQVFQESFAKYAYFTDIEPSNISFGGGDQIWGPVHTNSDVKVYSSGATFHDEVRMGGQVVGGQYATFKKGYEEGVTPIAMPATTELTKLQSQAAAGGMSFNGNTQGGYGEATLRLEFVAIDLNGDGDVTDANEGFLKAYRNANADWVSGDVPSSGLRYAEHCGHFHPDGTFVSAADHPTNGPDSWVASVTNNTRRCFLGGADEIWGQFRANDVMGGEWLEWGGPVSPLVAGRPDANYLFPLSRALNPNFKGVIYVDGKVVISGIVRGRVTVAASDQIIIGDDITYSIDPGLGTCEDILGIFSGDDVVVADNALNAPQQRGNGQAYFTYDETKDEFIHGIVLALNVFTVENYNSGSDRDERCESTNWGRGCLYLTGGIIQRVRGAVGLSGGEGYLKRYAYDRCGATAPPPYFPTTGHFARGEQYQVDPVGFNVDDYFSFLTSN